MARCSRTSRMCTFSSVSPSWRGENRGTDLSQRHLAVAVIGWLALSPAMAQTTNIDAFKDGADEAKVHSASGFVCPLFIGHFERDAFGERAPMLGSDFCAYSALDGVYGTITLTPLRAAYDPKTALQQEFTEQEGIGG